MNKNKLAVTYYTYQYTHNRKIKKVTKKKIPLKASNMI